jgi:CubicO group peptidase (beta-lactamase class C family)
MRIEGTPILIKKVFLPVLAVILLIVFTVSAPKSVRGDELPSATDAPTITQSVSVVATPEVSPSGAQSAEAAEETAPASAPAPATEAPTPSETAPAVEETPEPTAPIPEDTAGAIQAAVDTAARKYGAVGVQVAVIRDGEIADTFVYGDATRGEKPMDDTVKIRVASISKVILGMEVMRLRELGKLDLDADIGDYWGFSIRNPRYEETPITIRQILSHTSSMIVYDYGFSADGALVRSRFEDGSCFGKSTPGVIGSWNYNNYGFSALGLTVETALDETVNALAARDLFEPLGIDAAFGTGSISDTDNLATIYSGGSVGRSVSTQKKTLGSTFPGENGEEFPGGIAISAYDLAKLIAALANDGEYNGVRVLSPESVAEMESSQGKTGGFEQCLPLRFRTELYGEDELYYHTGSNYGMFNLFSYNPNTRNGVVVLTSGASGDRDKYDIYAVCGEISRAVYGIL